VPLLPWLGFRTTPLGQECQRPPRTKVLAPADEGAHISARHGQLMAYLIKKKVIKIGWANG